VEEFPARGASGTVAVVVTLLRWFGNVREMIGNLILVFISDFLLRYFCDYGPKGGELQRFGCACGGG
jgi:hypothetical protein